MSARNAVVFYAITEQLYEDSSDRSRVRKFVDTVHLSEGSRVVSKVRYS